MIPVIVASQPTSVTSRVFDKWWVRSIQVFALRGDAPVHARVELVKFCSGESGEVLFSDETRVIEIDDVAAAAAQNQSVSVALESMVAAVSSIASLEGIAVQ